LASPDSAPAGTVPDRLPSETDAADDGDLRAIRGTVSDYFLGLYHSDTARLRAAFHPRAVIAGHFRGRFVCHDLDGFLAVVAKTPPPVTAGEAFDMRLVSLRRSDSIAEAVVEDLYVGLVFTDALSLVKVDGAWCIMAKTFRHA